MLIPQGMGYALLAGLPPIYGLYASLVPGAVYALLGSSRQLSVGPVALVSLLVAAGVEKVSGGSEEAYVAAAVALAFLVGLLQVSLGLFRLGFLVNFLSHPVVTGFTSAAGLLIGFSQIGHLLGVSLPRTHYVHVTAQAAFEQADQIQGLTVAMGITAVFLLIGLKRWAPSFPRALLVVVGGTVAVWALNLQEHGVAVVGAVPSGLPPIGVPDLTLQLAGDLSVVASTITLVGFMGSIAIARRYASEQKYQVDANRELVSLGLANLLGSFAGAYPATGGLSRTVVNAQAGATSGVAGLMTSLLVGLTLLFLTPIFYFLPKAVLAAIIVTAAISLVDVREARHLWTVKRSDLVMMLVTFAGTLAFGIEAGILLGVSASLAAIVLKSTLPHVAVLGRLPGTRYFRNVDRFSEAVRTPGILAVRIDSQFYFGNVNFLKETMSRLEDCESVPLEAVILDASGVNRIDASAVAALNEILDDYRARNVRFVFTDVKGPVRDVLARSGFFEALGEDNVFFDVDDAMSVLSGRRDRSAHGPPGLSANALRPVPEWPSYAAPGRDTQKGD